MIQKDQPSIFGDAVIAVVSSVEDGNMKYGLNDDRATQENRRRFLALNDIDTQQTTLVALTYDTDDFAKYRIVKHQDKGTGMELNTQNQHADALVVAQSDHALFLPLADCVGAVLYDPINHVLMVSHLGRHSVEILGAKKSIEYLIDHCGSNPADILTWLSPAVGNATYPLKKFAGKSLHEAITDQLVEVGVNRHNIEISSIDTAMSDNYFSHSQFLKDSTQPNGRFAIVAMMRGQGEPAV